MGFRLHAVFARASSDEPGEGALAPHVFELQNILAGRSAAHGMSSLPTRGLVRDSAIERRSSGREDAPEFIWII
jgi:hypothetical protein